eukprot:PITA_31815
MFLLHYRLKHIKGRLKEWNKKEFGNIFKAKGEVEKRLKEINQILIIEGYTEERKEMSESLQQEWDNRCLQEKILWRQKSRVQWIKEGERNTKFFHRSTIDHRNNNRIVKLTNQHGIESNTHEEMEKVLLQHFQKIVEETSEDRYQFMKKFNQYIPKLVTKEDNFKLNRPVTEEETEEAMKEMQNGKAQGPDGFNVDFFKACWRIVKQDILEEKATSPDRFQPIALCNVIYKIISKVIANRLKPLLPTVVSEEQTGYVEGRQILDNRIQAHETVHSLITNKQAGMIMQLDISKAYDKLSWSYIRAILKSYGFDYNWIKWVMALVTTSRCSILLNGAPSKTFKPSRGLRQGDPLSPFLFILMMEGLGRATRFAKEEGRIQGLRLTQGGDTVTH